MMNSFICLICSFLVAIPIYAGVIAHGVRTFSKQGSTLLRNNVSISEGSNITLTEIGQNITISATSAGGSGTNMEIFTMNGGVTVMDDVDGIRQSLSNQTLNNIIVCEFNSGITGTTTVQANWGPSLQSNTTINLAANLGKPACTTVSPVSAINTNDLMNITVNAAAGSAEDLSVKFSF